MTALERIRDASRHRLHDMKSALAALDGAVVAFSGGVDSTFVLAVAREVLGERVVALTAHSPSVPLAERAEARELARRLAVRHLEVESREMDDPRYAANPVDRCYYCKTELFAICERKRAELGLAAVLDGFNADDLKDVRPGHVAAKERKVRSPLADAGLTKEEIRAFSRELGLPTWDKPQMACLASRIPYGTAVTAARLEQVGSAESSLRALGLKQFRIRYHGEVARLEVAAEEYSRFHDESFRAQVDRALRSRGFSFVALDLEPFRSGRMNETAAQG